MKWRASRGPRTGWHLAGAHHGVGLSKGCPLASQRVGLCPPASERVGPEPLGLREGGPPSRTGEWCLSPRIGAFLSPPLSTTIVVTAILSRCHCQQQRHGHFTTAVDYRFPACPLGFRSSPSITSPQPQSPLLLLPTSSLQSPARQTLPHDSQPPSPSMAATVSPSRPAPCPRCSARAPPPFWPGRIH